MRRPLGAVACVAALLCTACGPRLVSLPTAAGPAASDGAEVLAQATAACRMVATMTAEIAVSGSVAGRRVRGRLLAGLSQPASVRLEAVAPAGPPVFVFVAQGGDSTLFLPRDRRVLQHGRPEAVLEAIAAVPLDAAGLRTALTGCALAPETGRTLRPAVDWRIVPDGSAELYVRKESDSGGWRILAAVHRGTAGQEWRAEYRDFQNAPTGELPHSVRLIAADAGRFDLRLALSQVDINMSLGPDVFEVRVPPDADPITLEELRQNGPLASGGR